MQKGISLTTVPTLLGHDSLQTTAIDLTLTDVHIQDELERKWRGRPILGLFSQLDGLWRREQRDRAT